MISIAICDDEAVFAEALHALVDAGMKEILYGRALSKSSCDAK